ncbi:MAG: PmoA family protein [Anaerolineae bacterium]|nr:PmoA family protein [Anaerolineae bacterium]
MDFQLTHVYGDCLELAYRGRPLFRYTYMPETPAVEAPKPYFHPLYTLDGDVVTLFRPHDHRWHHGLAMTCAHLSGENFWGGGTYVHRRAGGQGPGYVVLDNIGRQAHQAWDQIDCTPDGVVLRERLLWITQAGATWINEARRIAVTEVDPARGCWRLEFGTRLTNVHAEPLVFSSPTVEGRPKAGYGGLFWRGVRAFTGGAILMGGGLEAEGDEADVIGKAAPWLAFVGQHDGVDRSATLLFLDQPGNPRYPNKWFVRAQAFACASFALTFDEAYTLPPGAALALDYHIVVGNGAWSRAQIEAYISRAAR